MQRHLGQCLTIAILLALASCSRAPYSVLAGAYQSEEAASIGIGKSLELERDYHGGLLGSHRVFSVYNVLAEKFIGDNVRLDSLSASVRAQVKADITERCGFGAEGGGGAKGLDHKVGHFDYLYLHPEHFNANNSNYISALRHLVLLNICCHKGEVAHYVTKAVQKGLRR